MMKNVCFLVFISWAEAETSLGGDELSEAQRWELQANPGTETQRPREKQPKGAAARSLQPAPF